MDKLTHKPLARFIEDQCMVNYHSYDEDTKHTIREIGVRNMHIERRLFALLRKLEEKKISNIVIKGCHLIQAVYPFGIRPLEDMDILIDRKDYAAADEAIRGLGYDDRAFGLDVWTHIMVSNKLTYTNSSHPLIPIDIHYSLGPYPYLGRISFESLFEHSELLSNEKVTMRVLNPEMLLVHLCLHLYQHHDDHWQISAYDLGTLTTIEQNRFDWSRFSSIVSMYSLSLPIRHSLQKAETIASIQIPDFILKELDSMKVSKWEQYIYKASLYLNKGMEKYLLQLLTLPDLKLKLQCLKRAIIPPRPFLRYYYKDSYLRYVIDVCRTITGAFFHSK